jgi:hypothetical protein
MLENPAFASGSHLEYGSPKSPIDEKTALNAPSNADSPPTYSEVMRH